MCDAPVAARAECRRREPVGARRDAGITFPEVIVTVVVLAMLAAVMSSALVMTMRQQDNTRGRISVAAAEQGLGVYLPNDLASAEIVGEDAGVLTLAWTDVATGAPAEARYSHTGDDSVARQLCLDDVCQPPRPVARAVPADEWRELLGEIDSAGRVPGYQVQVRVDGGGDAAGAGGGAATLVWAAARVARGTIAGDSTHNAPTLANLCAAGYVTAGCP